MKKTRVGLSMGLLTACLVTGGILVTPTAAQAKTRALTSVPKALRGTWVMPEYSDCKYVKFTAKTMRYSVGSYDSFRKVWGDPTDKAQHIAKKSVENKKFTLKKGKNGTYTVNYQSSNWYNSTPSKLKPIKRGKKVRLLVDGSRYFHPSKAFRDSATM